MTDSVTNQPPTAPPAHSVADLAASLEKMKRAKIWWWQRDDILKARMSVVVLALILLAAVLSIYLSLLLTHRLIVKEFHIVLIMLLALVIFFFLHSLARLLLAAMRLESSSTRSASPANLDIDIESQPRARNPNRTTVHVTFVRGPGGYAIPAAPIPIAFLDEEIIEDGDVSIDGSKASNTLTTLPPPAYGLWRSSVRVNPDQFYWVRRGNDDNAPTMGPVEMEARTPPPPLDGEMVGRVAQAHTMAPVQAVYRPPSYTSEDGVDYVLGGPRLAGAAVLLASSTHAPGRVEEIREGEIGVVLGEGESNGARGMPREQQQGQGDTPCSREQSPSGARRLA